MKQAWKPSRRGKKGCPPLLPPTPLNMDSLFGPGLVQKVSDSSPLARTLLRCVTESAGKALGNRTLLAAAVGGLLGLPEVRNLDALSAEWSLPETSRAPEVAQEGTRISVRFTSRRHQPPAQGLVTLLNNAVGAVLWRLQNLTSPCTDLQTYWPQMPEPTRRTMDLRPGAKWPREMATAEIHCRVGDLEVTGELVAIVSQPHVVIEIVIEQAWWSTPEAAERFHSIWGDAPPLTTLIPEAIKPLLRYLADMLGWVAVDGTTPTAHSFNVLADVVSHAWQSADEAERAADRASGELKVQEKKLKDALAVQTQLAAQQRAAADRIADLEEGLTKAGRHANALEGKLLAAARQAQDAAPSDQSKLLQQQIDQLRKERDDLAVSNDALRQDVHALQQRLVPSLESATEAAPESIPDPEDYALLPGWVAETFKGRLVLTRKAAKAAAGSMYHDPSVVFAALRAMGEHLHPVLAGDRPGEMAAYEAALTAVCCEDSAVGEAINDSRYVSDYMATHAGQPLVLDRHVKRGSTFDPRTCMRIYYTWDARKQVIVIGHLTAHLTNRAT